MVAIKKSEPINLVLSGGGVKGIAHVALLEYLETIGIKINAIAGSSAGALVGALYASGKRPKEILSFFRSTPIFRYTWLNPSKAGIFNSENYTDILPVFVKERFEELIMPLHIVATNIEEGRAETFSSGILIRPLVASCAVPAVFSPMEINGSLYADGGVMDNFPISPFISQTHQILGSYVATPSVKLKSDLTSILKVTNHSNKLLLHSANEHKFELCTHTVIYPLSTYGTFETKSIDRIYQEAKVYLKTMYGSL